MTRSVRLCAALAILALPLLACLAASPADDPVDAPPPPPAAKAATVGDLVKTLGDAKTTQADAQVVRDTVAKELVDSDALLASKTADVATADKAVKKAIAKVGPVIVDGVVYEPTSDGYRTFKPASSDTPVPDDPTPPA